jgi:hypothetical protein
MPGAREAIVSGTATSGPLGRSRRTVRGQALTAVAEAVEESGQLVEGGGGRQGRFT